MIPGAAPVGILSPLHPFLNSGCVTSLGSLAFSWGAMRRFAAGCKAGELAIAASPGALPRAMFLAGLRTLSGTVVLIEACGPYGLVRPLSTDVLASPASQRTLETSEMDAMRLAVDLGAFSSVLENVRASDIR